MRKLLAVLLCLSLIPVYAGYSSGGRSGGFSSGGGRSYSSYSGARSYGSSYSSGGRSGYVSNSYGSYSRPAYSNSSYRSSSYSSPSHTTVINNNHSHSGGGFGGGGFWSGMLGGYMGASMAQPHYVAPAYGIAQPSLAGAPVVAGGGMVEPYVPIANGYSYGGASIFFCFLFIILFIAFVLWLLFRSDHHCH